MEIWKDIKNYEGHYQVSNCGNVRSIKKSTPITLKQFISKQVDYYAVGLWLNGKSTIIRTHTLVAEAFLGARPHKYVVDHIDQNKHNNHIDNLRYVTYSQNHMNKSFMSNSTTGTIGVSIETRTGRYRSHIKINGKQKHLGYFDNIEDAIKARKDAELIYFNFN